MTANREIIVPVRITNDDAEQLDDSRGEFSRSAYMRVALKEKLARDASTKKTS